MNLLFKNLIFSNKIAKAVHKDMSSVKKKYISNFSNSLEQITTSPTRTTDRTAALSDHALRNSSRNISQLSVTDLGLPDYDFMFYTRTQQLHVQS